MSSNAAPDADDEITSHAGTLDLTPPVLLDFPSLLTSPEPPLPVETGDNNADIEAQPHPDSSRSYGSNLRQYRSTILFGLVIVALLVVAVALSAISLQKSNEALALAAKNASPTKNTEQNASVGGDYHAQKEKLPVPDAPSNLKETPSTASPTTASPTREPTTSAPITSTPTAPQPTTAPTETHPLNPKWFHTDHYQYQALVNAGGNEDMHPWLMAGTFCYRQSLEPCDYDAYCPNGKSSDPFHGGPPEKTSGWEDRKSEQWSPIANENGFEWVQVGSIPDDEGGDEGSRCLTWDEFKWANGQNIKDVRGEEYKQWILCCEEPGYDDAGDEDE